MTTITFANLTNLQTNSFFKNVNRTFRCRAENLGLDDDSMMIWNDDIFSIISGFTYLMLISLSVIDVTLI